MIKSAGDQNRPHALLIEHDSLAHYTSTETFNGDFPMSREDAVAVVADALDETAIVVASLGKLSRELFEYRQKNTRTQ